jgi:hypothetical protein
MHIPFFRWPEGSKQVLFVKGPPRAVCKTSPL